jgi:hypothetical protein
MKHGVNDIMKITRADLRQLIKEVIAEGMTRDDIKRMRQRYDPDETPGATEMGGHHAIAGRPPLKAAPEGVSSNIADMWMRDYRHAYDSIKQKEMGEAYAMEGKGDKMSQLQDAIEKWMAETGFEPTDRLDLEYEAKKAAKTPRPKDRHPAFSAIMGIGGPWGRGPELEAAIKNISYEIMGGEKPEYTPDPEPEFSQAQLDALAQGERSSNQRMRRKYTK